jgi:hypothetical protein
MGADTGPAAATTAGPTPACDHRVVTALTAEAVSSQAASA